MGLDDRVECVTENLIWEGEALRKLGLCAVVVLGLVLAGCGPGLARPSEIPVETVETPVEVVTPSPSPSWSVVQQGSIDAVQRFWQVWARIAQNLETADWDDLHEVADDTALSNAFAVWSDWSSQGYHLSGSPTFTPSSVMESRRDHHGTQYIVRGCYSIERSTLVDSSGQPNKDRGLDRSIGIYRVLHATDGTYAVIEIDGKEESC